MAEVPPTEALLEPARHLDKLRISEVLSLIHGQDGCAHAAVSRALPEMERAVEVLACALAGGGRWFNVGAGTSGRIGALDAAEIPPTFGMPGSTVQALIAGGDRALRQAVEGAEDSAEASAFELAERGLRMGDVVVGISASGRTPYTLGALAAARKAGARRISISCNPGSPLVEAAEIAIVVEVGPEVVAGSTRMKGGLAQKMVLHALSTAVMVQLGRVEGNFMTHLTPVSEKLQGRALRIVMTLAGVDEAAARELLDRAEGNPEAALRLSRASQR